MPITTDIVSSNLEVYNIMWSSLSMTYDRSMIFSETVSSTNKIDRHDIAEILLKVALNTIKQTNKQIKYWEYIYNNNGNV